MWGPGGAVCGGRSTTSPRALKLNQRQDHMRRLGRQCRGPLCPAVLCPAAPTLRLYAPFTGPGHISSPTCALVPPPPPPAPHTHTVCPRGCHKDTHPLFFYYGIHSLMAGCHHILTQRSW